MKPHRVQRMILEYTVVIEPAEEGGYIAYVPTLPGCATQGETLEEIFRMAKDAIEGYIAVLKEMKQDVPIERQGTIVTKIPALLPTYDV